MFIKVNGKTLVVGMKWSVMISDGSVAKAVRASKSTWYWNSGSSFSYGVLPKDEKVGKKDLPLYSAVIAFAAAHSEGNALAILSVPDTEDYVVCGVYQGRPIDGYDLTVDSPEQVSQLITAFTDVCGENGFTLLGDVPVDSIVPYSLDRLADAATDYAQLKKVKSDLVNPVTILIGVAAIGFIGNLGWQQFAKYRQQEAARKLAASQKSAQQLYDDALARKREEVGFFASDAPLLMTQVLKLPVQVGGWNLEKVNCAVAQTKAFVCTMRFAKGKSLEVNNKTFLQEAAPLKFKSITYQSDLKTIEALSEITNLPFITLGKAIDASVSQKEELLHFGSHLQKLLPFGTPSLSDFTAIALPPGVQEGQLTALPMTSSTWKPSGPIRILELFTAFPKYAVLNSISVQIDKSPRYRFNESFITVAADGTVFAKPN